MEGVRGGRGALNGFDPTFVVSHVDTEFDHVCATWLAFDLDSALFYRIADISINLSQLLSCRRLCR